MFVYWHDTQITQITPASRVPLLNPPAIGLTSARTPPGCESQFLNPPSAAAAALTSTQNLPGSESRFLNPPSATAAALTGAQTLPACESRFLDLPSAAAVTLTGAQTLPASHKLCQHGTNSASIIQTLPVLCESRFLNPPSAAAVALTSAQTLPGHCESKFLNPPSAAAVALTGAQTLPASCELRFLNPPSAAIALTGTQTPPGCNSQQAMITTCAFILKRHLIFEHSHSVQLGAAICMCAQQIFFDGSAKKQTFTSAFERAVAVFSKQASASGFLDEIEPWVDRHKGDLRNPKSGNDPDLFQKARLIKTVDRQKSTNMAQEVVDMIKKYRPRE
ncbi:hypothetical protein B0H13DRAFT_1936099 [Mycena leptocephala]|nr:hypothetical protein B0H13DRAFT_1936099 [Mycena leptocephala]